MGRSDCRAHTVKFQDFSSARHVATSLIIFICQRMPTPRQRVESSSVCLIILFNSSKKFGKLLLQFNVRVSFNHDPLRLRRTCTMHRFGLISNGAQSHLYILYKSKHSEPGFRRYLLGTLQVFGDVVSGFGVFEILFRGKLPLDRLRCLVPI